MARKLALPCLAATAAAAFALSSPAAAAEDYCSGFEDVLASATYCSAVDWVKTRGITVGCTDTSHYCPDLNVSRQQMALFMNRLGNALTPQLARDTEYYLGGDLDPGMLFIDCSVYVPAAAHARIVRLSGTYYGAANGPDANVKMFYRLDGSDDIYDIGGFSLPVPVGDPAAVTFSSQWALDPDTGYEFILGPGNDSEGTLAMGDSQCSLDSMVVDYTAPTAAADKAPASSSVSRLTPRAVPLPRAN